MYLKHALITYLSESSRWRALCAVCDRSENHQGRIADIRSARTNKQLGSSAAVGCDTHRLPLDSPKRTECPILIVWPGHCPHEYANRQRRVC